MNCFEWQNRASDYLDGTLMGPLKTGADQHLDSCSECAERHKHFRIILSSIASQPRSALPIPIRKSPLPIGLPKFDIGRISRSRWDQIPWYLRTSIEGAGIVLMILLGISAGPKLRSIYEKSMEANLEDLTQSFRDWKEYATSRGEAGIPLARGKVLQTSGTASAPEHEEFSSGDSDSDSDSDDDSDSVAEGSGDAEIRVGNSQIWRFMLKTDSPHEIRSKIVQILTDLQIPSDTPGLGGVEAPGGIQFDLLLPQSVVSGLKKQLQAIAPKAPAELAQTPAGETFTWYMNKSKTRLPAQKTRVVIWLSQM